MQNQNCKIIKNRNASGQKGQALIGMLLLFAAGTSVLLSGLGYSQLKGVGDARASSFSKQSFFSSESALEDAVYRLKTSKSLGAADQISIAGSQGMASIAAVEDGKQITSIGTDNNYERNTAVTLSTSQTVSFDYALEADEGGIFLSGTSGAYGDAHANGPITSDASGFITGDTTAASDLPIIPDESNTTPLPPPQNIDLGQKTGQKDFAQSFRSSNTSALAKVALYLKKTDSPPDLTVYIVEDNGGVPGTNELAEGTVSADSVTNNYGWADAFFSSNPTITAGTTYWIVLESDMQAEGFYTIGVNSDYPNGTGKIGHYKFSWLDTTPAGLDGYFNLYIGGAPVIISGPGQSSFNIGQNGAGDAYADRIVGVNAAGILYCQSGSLNNELCDTSRADPVAQAFSVSSENITKWKNEASGGGTFSGDKNIGASGATLGPEEINGNLTVDSGGTLTISGTLYVTGNISISGGANIKLASSYGADDGVIVSDGTITIDGGSNISGSGTNGSSVMLLTTNTGDNAISLSDGSTAQILNAQGGIVNISGGSDASEASGYQINLSGGSSVTYQNDLANAVFSSGPSGGYSISGWQETP